MGRYLQRFAFAAAMPRQAALCEQRLRRAFDDRAAKRRGTSLRMPHRPTFRIGGVAP